MALIGNNELLKLLMFSSFFQEQEDHAGGLDVAKHQIELSISYVKKLTFTTGRVKGGIGL